MNFFQVTVALTAFVGYVIAQGSGQGDGSRRDENGAGRVPDSDPAAKRAFLAAPGSGALGGESRGVSFESGSGPASSERQSAPALYQFDYKAVDKEGNSHFREEWGEADGVVRGSYGYNDAQGLYRFVLYYADENGFHATVETNEPGTDGKENPADVDIDVEQPPAGLQDKFASRAGGKYRGSGDASLGGASRGVSSSTSRSTGRGYGAASGAGNVFSTATGSGGS